MPDGSFISSKFVHDENATVPIYVTLSGITNDFKPLQSLNTPP